MYRTVRDLLRSDLERELLHVDTSDLASLRRECHKYEEYFQSIRPQYRSNFKRTLVNSIQVEERQKRCLKQKYALFAFSTIPNIGIVKS